MRKPLVLRLTLAVLAALLPAVASPQSFAGSVAGRVLDESNAVVAGAELVLRNVATGIEIKRTTGEDGEYAFRNLVPATPASRP